MCKVLETNINGVADFYLEGQNFQIFCEFEQTKMAISLLFFIWSWRNFRRFIGGLCLMRTCVKYKKNVHWYWRCLSGRTKCSNIYEFEQTKMAISLPFWIRSERNLTWFIEGVVVNACAEYWVKMIIGIGDIHPDGQIFQTFCEFEEIKIAVSRPFLIYSWRNFTGFMEGLYLMHV